MMDDINSYKKILIFGGPAVGKTTIAKKIANTFGLPLISLDDIMYEGNNKRKESEMSAILNKKLITHKSWVIEGGSIGWSDLLFEKADAVLILQASLPICLYRIIIRYIKERKYTLVSTVKFCLKVLPKYYTRPVRNYYNKFNTKKVIVVNTDVFSKLNSITL